MSDWSDVESNEKADLTFHDCSISFASELNQKKTASVPLSKEHYLILTSLTLSSSSMVSHLRLLNAAFFCGAGEKAEDRESVKSEHATTKITHAK